MYSVHSVDNTGTLPVGRCAHAVNIQSALGVAVFVASVILHHASRHLTCASLRHRSLSR